jgi:FdhD protein
MIRSYPGIKTFKGDSITVQDALVVESPLIIVLNDEPFTVTMQSPGKELELALGLLITEGILSYKSSASIEYELNLSETESSIRFHFDPSTYSIANKRSLMSIAACGICGKTDWKVPEGDPLHNKENSLILDYGFETMFNHQQAFHASGGLHAASIFDGQQNLLTIHEDIGRHNAVDKCIGDLFIKQQLQKAEWLLVSGRISYEIIAKCFKAKISNIAAVSAPSSLAVDFAKEWGIHLWGFCREGRQTQYA